MRISILCSDKNHPVIPFLQEWKDKHRINNDINLVHDKDELSHGDLLFMISCNQILRKRDRDKFKTTLVIHASDLPKGRGWSPQIWQILEGSEIIPVTLLEAEDKVDSGDIWAQVYVPIPTHALWDEINELLFRAESELMDFAVENFRTVVPHPQDPNITPTFYPKRLPADSELDPSKSIEEQFDLLRVCDPNRFPAFFKLRGNTYQVTIKKI